jgi:uncharacterized protein DUF4145
MTYVAPEFKRAAFHCPFCGAYAHMAWRELHFASPSGLKVSGEVEAYCSHCNASSVWLNNGPMIFPARMTAPLPHNEMPKAVLADYEEARQIASASPRGATALLRLAIQKLCIALGQPGKNLNDDIGALVRAGLPIEIQQALDIVRVVGNNAVHPGELSDDDVAAVSGTLFELVNLIVEDRIARPKKLSALFDGLPQRAKDAIERHDS